MNQNNPDTPGRACEACGWDPEIHRPGVHEPTDLREQITTSLHAAAVDRAEGHLADARAEERRARDLALRFKRPDLLPVHLRPAVKHSRYYQLTRDREQASRAVLQRLQELKVSIRSYERILEQHAVEYLEAAKVGG